MVTKLGICFVSGRIKLGGTVDTMTDILGSTEVPAPQTGVGVYITAGYWTSISTRLMRVGVGAGGGLRIMYGAAGSFDFSFSYPIGPDGPGTTDDTTAYASTAVVGTSTVA